MPWGSVVRLDGGSYLCGADSLSRGMGYRIIEAIGAPPLSTYPPLQSAVLSVVYRIQPSYPGNQTLLRCLMVALSTAGLLLVFRALVARGVPLIGAAGLVVLVATGSTWNSLVWNYMAEPLFLVLVGCLAWWTEPGRLPSLDSSKATRWWMVLGMLAGLMYLARSAALGIVAGMGLAALAGGWWRRIRAGVGFVVPFAGLAAIWVSMPKLASGGYAAYFASRLEELGGLGGYAMHSAAQAMDQVGCHALLSLTSDLALNFPHAGVVARSGMTPWAIALGWVAGACGVGLAAVGFVRTRQRGDAAALAVILAYLAQLSLWPFAMGPRGAVFLLPWVGAWAWRGWRSLGWTAHPLPWSALALAIGVTNGYYALGFRNQFDGPRSTSLQPVAAWLNRQDRAAVVSVGPGLDPYDVFASMGRPLLVGEGKAGGRYVPVPQPDVQPRYVVTTSPTGKRLSGLPVVFSSPPFLVVEMPPAGRVAETGR